MKNRKLFAIITLVAFMLTMMPLMAFATTASGSSISVDDNSAKVVTEDDGELTVDALKLIVDLDEGVVAGKDQFVIVFAERNGALSDTDYFKVGSKPMSPYTGTWSNYVNNVTCGYVVLTPSQAKEETLYVFSKTAGTVTFKAYVITGEEFDDEGIATYYNGSSDLLRAALVGNGCSGKFNAQSNAIAATYSVDGSSYTAVNGINAVSIDSNKPANNGVDYYDFSMKFTKGGSKLVGEDVTISIDKDGCTSNKTEVTTSATGKVEFKVSASKPGTYTVTVECGSFSQDFKVTFGAAQISKVNITYTTQGTIAVDEVETVAMMVTAFDSNGNALAASEVGATAAGVSMLDAAGGQFVAEITDAPDDSTLEDTTIDFYYNTATADGLYLSFEPDAVGEYTIKVYSKVTGVASTTTIKADEFGTVDHATISYPAEYYTLGSKTHTPTVYVFDQNGVKKVANRTAKYSYTGLGVSAINGAGQLTFKSDSDYAGNEIVVSVVAQNKYAASTTLKIAAEAAALKFTEANAEVGGEATVNSIVVDVNGNATAISAGGYYNVDVQSAIITEKPEGATVSVDADYYENSMATFLKKGTGKVVLTSNKEGTVKANVVLKLTATEDKIVDGISYPVATTYVADNEGAYKKVTDNDGNVSYVAADEDYEGQLYSVKANKNPYTFYLSGVATANFGEKVADKTTGDTITFIIGSTTFVANGSSLTSDVAPYVVDGRTFIPVRAFAEATGAKVEYDAATQVITITGEGLSAQMTVGSNILTVNGQTTVMDTAATVTAEGRTVLPVRFAGQALGYSFEVAYGSNGAVSSVTMFK